MPIATCLPPYDWQIEGLDGLAADQIQHMDAFYCLLKRWYAEKEYTSVLLTKEDYNKRVEFLCYMRDGGDCRESWLAGNTNSYKWYRKYYVFTVGGGDKAVLVIRPKKVAIDVSAMRLTSFQQPSYAGRLFADLWKIHKEDHCKGTTFYSRVRNKLGNVTWDV